MSTSKKQSELSSDSIKWLIAGLFAVFMFIVDFKFTSLPAYVVSILCGVCLVAALAIVSTTSLGARAKAFISDAKLELLKVVWPSRQETLQMTMTIMVVVFVISMVLWGVDSSLLWLVGKLTSLK